MNHEIVRNRNVCIRVLISFFIHSARSDSVEVSTNRCTIVATQMCVASVMHRQRVIASNCIEQISLSKLFHRLGRKIVSSNDSLCIYCFLSIVSIVFYHSPRCKLETSIKRKMSHSIRHLFVHLEFTFVIQLLKN